MGEVQAIDVLALSNVGLPGIGAQAPGSAHRVGSYEQRRVIHSRAGMLAEHVQLPSSLTNQTAFDLALAANELQGLLGLAKDVPRAGLGEPLRRMTIEEDEADVEVVIPAEVSRHVVCIATAEAESEEDHLLLAGFELPEEARMFSINCLVQLLGRLPHRIGRL